MSETNDRLARVKNNLEAMRKHHRMHSASLPRNVKSELWDRLDYSLELLVDELDELRDRVDRLEHS